MKNDEFWNNKFAEDRIAELETQLADCKKEVDYWKNSWKRISENYSDEKSLRMNLQAQNAALDKRLGGIEQIAATYGKITKREIEGIKFHTKVGGEK